MNILSGNTIKFFCLLMFISCAELNAAVKLPAIFTHNMVLQRDRTVKIWGWADNGEAVAVTFNGQKVKTKADKKGAWAVTLAPMQYGGPFEMTIAGKSNSIVLNNILIGDVWVCSGQSNMEWTLKRTKDAEKEIAESNYPKIRLFTVTKALSFKPKEDLSGEWHECNPQTSGDFSAVAYFFARKLQKELDIPIGLINTSWGGTNIETWTSWDVMSQIDPYKTMKPQELENDLQTQAQNIAKYQAAMKADKGLEEKWFDPTASVSGWKKIMVPKEWGGTEIGNVDGIVWFKREFELPAALAGKKGVINLGPIDDWDATYINGTLIGGENDPSKDRSYAVAEGILREGKNAIVIKVTDNQGNGGIIGKPEKIFYEAEGQKISLAGEWEYKSAVLTSDFGVKQMGPNHFPSQLYNAMVAPIIRYGIKGAIWYQGEANTGAAFKYRTLFPNLIRDWRQKWGYDFPFLWVQLANFKAPVDQPAESDWAELREAQNMTLSLPKTGQAVIIDIGEANDIHPRNKQDVGYRLALAALKTAYDKDVVYSGPVYQSMKTEGNKVVLSFTNTGSGLKVKDKYGYLRGFAIAGGDQKFVWAKAYLEGDKVIVYSDDISTPVAVRYAWGNNPDDANLYNNEGIPASPFRTDNWKGITEGR